jgi:hypothetical protein
MARIMDRSDIRKPGNANNKKAQETCCNKRRCPAAPSAYTRCVRDRVHRLSPQRPMPSIMTTVIDNPVLLRIP